MCATAVHTHLLEMTLLHSSQWAFSQQNNRKSGTKRLENLFKLNRQYNLRETFLQQYIFYLIKNIQQLKDRVSRLRFDIHLLHDLVELTRDCFCSAVHNCFYSMQIHMSNVQMYMETASNTSNWFLEYIACVHSYSNCAHVIGAFLNLKTILLTSLSLIFFS